MYSRPPIETLEIKKNYSRFILARHSLKINSDIRAINLTQQMCIFFNSCASKSKYCDSDIPRFPKCTFWLLFSPRYAKGRKKEEQWRMRIYVALWSMPPRCWKRALASIPSCLTTALWRCVVMMWRHHRRVTYVAIVRISFLSRGALAFSAGRTARASHASGVNRFITGRLDFADTYVECAHFDRDLRHGSAARFRARFRASGRRGISRNS